jgi:hypothetical protein
MSKNKTSITENSVIDFISSIPVMKKRKDCLYLIDIIKAQTKLEAKMWGTSIIGFGNYHYKYESGREGDAPLISFSPRKNAISLYFGTFDKKEELLAIFGNYQAGKGCININNLRDINIDILIKMINSSVKRKHNINIH